MPLAKTRWNGPISRVIFAPVDLLIRTISFAPTLMLLLLVVPDGYVAYLLFRQTSASVQFSRAEADGVTYIDASQAFLAELQHRRLALRVAALDPNAVAEVTASTQRCDAAEAAVDAVDARLGVELGTTDTWNGIKKSYDALKALGTSDPEKVDQAQSDLGVAVGTNLIQNQAGNNSNLILDPDLDSYWMMDAFVIKFPALGELVAHAGAQSAATMKGATLDPATRLDLAGQLALISSTASDLINVDLATALSDNEKFNDSEHRTGNHRLRALEPQFDALAAALNAYVDQVHKSLLVDAPGAQAGYDAAIKGQYLAGQILGVSADLGPELSRLCDERAARYAHTRLVGLIVAIAAFFGISYVFNGFYRSLTLSRNRLEEEHELLQGDILGLLNVVSDAAQGDLRVRAKVGEGDLGNVGDAFNQMLERWQELISAINTQLSRTNEAVVELKVASGRMAAGASQQAKEVMAAAVSVQRMSDQIHLVSGNAATAAQAAQRTQTSANEGNSSVRNVIVGMETLKNEVAAGAKKIKTLGDRSMEITSIVATIAKISEQTNMLALNAAIEAARAGDHGRGFSVVADEVRKLAERTASATQEIEKLVRTILTETSNSVGAIERQSLVVEEEGRAVASAGTALTRIRSESEQSTALVTDIARIAAAQAEDAVAVASTMDRISVIAGETANGANGSLDIAASLQELSAALRESVTRFKVH